MRALFVTGTVLPVDGGHQFAARATRVDDAETFLALAGPFLSAREAEHNLALGLIGRLRVEPRLYGFDPTFVVAEDAGTVVGCLLRTPPHGVVLSRFESLEAVDAVAEACSPCTRSCPGRSARPTSSPGSRAPGRG